MNKRVHAPLPLEQQDNASDRDRVREHHYSFKASSHSRTLNTRTAGSKRHTPVSLLVKLPHLCKAGLRGFLAVRLSPGMQRGRSSSRAPGEAASSNPHPVNPDNGRQVRRKSYGMPSEQRYAGRPKHRVEWTVLSVRSILGDSVVLVNREFKEIGRHFSLFCAAGSREFSPTFPRLVPLLATAPLTILRRQCDTAVGKQVLEGRVLEQQQKHVHIGCRAKKDEF